MNIGKSLGAMAAAALLALGACSSPEAQVDRAMAELERQEPVFAMLRQHEPNAYGEMRALVERAGRQGKSADQPELIKRSREIFAKVLARRMMTAPDDVVQQMVTFVADQAQALERNPPVCKALLAGNAGDLRPYVSPEMQQRERALYENLLKSSAKAERPVATQQQSEQVLAAMVEDAEAELGLDEAKLTSALEGSGPPLEVCRAQGFLMRRLSQLPASEGAPVFRFLTQLAAQAQRTSSPIS